MTLNVTDLGTDNIISYSAQDEPKLNGTITVRGSRNHLAIGPRAVANDVSMSLGSDCKVHIGSGCVLSGLFIYTAKKVAVVIGENTVFNGRVRLLLHEPGRIDIGANCLFASDVDITISDMHSIIDVTTGERVNPARNVVLEERVWVGQRAMILKGSHIEAGSIIGAGALVSGRIPANSLAVGVPAKVTRSGVTWRSKLL